jgi:3-keto-5-aminohexanoate cleavage enzyme
LPAAGDYLNLSVMNPERHWNLMAMAIGSATFVSAEDNPYLNPGELADSNARLVEKAVQLARTLGREIASPEEARAIIGLKSRNA